MYELYLLYTGCFVAQMGEVRNAKQF
jgi:hypothetical protein